jgi:glycosyltransferase involved in cell wall biosynthesis
MTDLPLVSVITPSFNQGRFLLDTLRSVGTQDYPRIEHIVMDGGSDDQSVEVLQSWSRSHPVRWQSDRDAGQADAIQRGLSLSAGDIIAWLNSDDTYLNPMVVSSAVAEFGKGATVVTGGGRYLSEDGRLLQPIPVMPTRVSAARLRCVDWVLQPATFVARDLMLAHPLDTTLQFAFDWDLFIRLSAETAFTTVDEEWAGYRLHRAAKTRSGGSRRRREILDVLRRHHGRSARYAAIRAFDLLCGGAESVPGKLGSVACRGLGLFSRLSNDLTDGRGMPFRPAVR